MERNLKDDFQKDVFSFTLHISLSFYLVTIEEGMKDEFWGFFAGCLSNFNLRSIQQLKPVLY